MGIDGLLSQLKPVLQTKHISELEGSTVAIDAMGWLYKGCYSCSYEICKGIPTYAYLHFTYQMVEMLRRNGIKPIVVIDGLPLPAKEHTNKIRTAIKQRNRELADKQFEEGNRNEALKFYSRCISIRKRFIYELVDLLKTIDVEYLIAPYESDAQIAYLCRMNYVDYAISEDSDLLCYNCPKVIFKLGINGECQILDLEGLRKRRKNKEALDNTFLNDFFSLSEENFTNACILAGCDYLPSVKGMGIKKAVSFFGRFKDIGAILRRLPYEQAFMGKVPEKYPELFEGVTMLFRHQLVFDIVQKKMVPLNSGVDEDVLDKMCYFVGRPLDVAEEFVRGNLNLKTLEVRERQELDPKQLFGTPTKKGGYYETNTQQDRINAVIKRTVQTSGIASRLHSEQPNTKKTLATTYVPIEDLANYEIPEELLKEETGSDENLSIKKNNLNFSAPSNKSSKKKEESKADAAYESVFEYQDNILQLICEEYSKSVRQPQKIKENVPSPQKIETIPTNFGKITPFTKQDSKEDFGYIDSLGKLKKLTEPLKAEKSQIENGNLDSKNSQSSEKRSPLSHLTNSEQVDMGKNSIEKKRNYSQFMDSQKKAIGTERKEDGIGRFESQEGYKPKKSKTSVDKNEKLQTSLNSFFKK